MRIRFIATNREPKFITNTVLPKSKSSKASLNGSKASSSRSKNGGYQSSLGKMSNVVIVTI